MVRYGEESQDGIERMLEARSYLGAPQSLSPEFNAALSEFDANLAAREYAFALAALADAGRRGAPDTRFWSTLSRAAALMGLGAQTRDYEERAQAVGPARVAARREMNQVRWLVFGVAWASVCVLLILAYDGHFGGPFFGDRSALGRFERGKLAPFYCWFAIACAGWLSAAKWHTRERLYWFSGFAISTYLWDNFYFLSAFGLCMLNLGLCASSLARAEKVS